MHRCDYLRDEMEDGDECPCEYARQRLAIERRHDPDAIFVKDHQLPERPVQALGPVDDDDPLTDLEPFGVGVRVLEKLVQNGCVTVADVRRCVVRGVIRDWEMCNVGTEKQVREALQRVDEERVKHE